MSGFVNRWLSVGVIFLLMVASVSTASAGEPLDLLKQQGQTSGQTAQTSGQTARSCNLWNTSWGQTLENCRQRAAAGDTQAMLDLARAYNLGIYFPKDLHESLRYYTLAAELGDKEAVRHLYDAYRWGLDVPKNEARADQYLNKAAQFGHEWAILLLAQAQEKTAPKKALEAYLKLGRNDDCIAQLRLAQAYESGDLVKQNLTQSYFWLLLATVDASNRKADVKYDVTSGISYESYSSGGCGYAASSLRGKIKAEEKLSKKLVQAAQDAATNWTKGTIEKLLPPPPPPPQITADEASPPDTKSKMPPKVATASPAEESSPKLTGPRSIELRAWIGKYPFDRLQGLAFFDHPDVQRVINATLGSNAASLMKDMSTVVPIEEHDNWLIAQGCQPHMCPNGNWLLAINLANLETRACLASIDSPTIRFGASGKNYIDLRRGNQNCFQLEPEQAVAIIDRVFAAPIASVSPTVPNSSAQSPNPSSRMGVALKKDGGIFVVPVEINGAITLDFGVDSGASVVTVPADVFSTLTRTGTIKDTDIIGETKMALADGSTSQSFTFTIRSLKVGNNVVQNVRASVTPARGDLLLGQSFLERFKSWSINNTNHELVLESQ
jgi:clan AA aspartic protease (TIGR02281 family)